MPYGLKIKQFGSGTFGQKGSDWTFALPFFQSQQKDDTRLKFARFSPQQISGWYQVSGRVVSGKAQTTLPLTIHSFLTFVPSFCRH